MTEVDRPAHMARGPKIMPKRMTLAARTERSWIREKNTNRSGPAGVGSSQRRTICSRGVARRASDLPKARDQIEAAVTVDTRVQDKLENRGGGKTNTPKNGEAVTATRN
jgi:hypothetical protein